MKIISLNTWGGRAGKEKLLNFLISHKSDTDVFCLQEIWSAPYSHLEGHKAAGKEIDHSKIMVYGLQEITKIFSDYTFYFRPHHGDHYGLLMLIKKGIDIKNEGELFVHKYKGYDPEGDIGKHARNIQFITLEYGDQPLTIINFHGLWNGMGKGDSEDRIIQSQNIVNFIKTLKGSIVMVGDFNLLPTTKSIAIIEKIGLRNLIRENNITTTRSSYYTKPDKFADYAFISRELKLKNFEVLHDEVSDHLPLLLELTKI